MSGKYLLDSNILIALFANESTVKKNLKKLNKYSFQVLHLVNCFMEHINQQGFRKILQK
jgi:hypothetical protein